MVGIKTPHLILIIISKHTGYAGVIPADLKFKESFFIFLMVYFVKIFSK